MRRLLAVLLVSLLLLLPGQVDAQSGLTEDLAAYWRLDEESGTRYDQVGSNDLTDNNTVGYTTGVIGNAADFLATNSEYLSAVDDDDLSVSDDFTISVWFYLPEDPDDYTGILSKGYRYGREYEYFLDLTPSEQIRFIVGDGVSDFSIITSGSVSLYTWYHLVAWYDSSSEEIYLQISGSTPLSESSVSPFDGDNTFLVGKLRNYGSEYSTIYVDEIGLWKRVLSADERSQLYNSGDGYDPTTYEPIIPGTITYTLPISVYTYTLGSGATLTVPVTVSFGQIFIAGSILIVITILIIRMSAEVVHGD